MTSPKREWKIEYEIRSYLEDNDMAIHEKEGAILCLIEKQIEAQKKETEKEIKYLKAVIKDLKKFLSGGGATIKMNKENIKDLIGSAAQSRKIQGGFNVKYVVGHSPKKKSLGYFTIFNP